MENRAVRRQAGDTQAKWGGDGLCRPLRDVTRQEAVSLSKQGSLLLVHGLLDENVHFRHTARLINHLIAARKRYQLLVFPDERHMPRHEKDRIYMEESVMDFISEKIGMPFSCT